MKKASLFLACAALLAPSVLSSQSALADGGWDRTKRTVAATCQFPTSNGTTSGLWGNWPACGDPGPLVAVRKGQCFFLTDVTFANNHVPGHTIVLEDGNHPGATSPSDKQYPYTLPAPGTVVQDFNTPIPFQNGLWVFDRSPGSAPQNPNVWVTVTGYLDRCPEIGDGRGRS